VCSPSSHDFYDVDCALITSTFVPPTEPAPVTW